MATTWIRGKLAVIGYQPDGDSVRFIPDDVSTFKRLDHSDRLDPSKKDGSVQLRLDAIDAPETHYEDEAQALGLPARDTLLAALGFTGLTYDADTTVTAATPEQVPAAIAASLLEEYGRPVSLLYTGDAAAQHADGDTVTLDDALVDASVNAEQTRNGRTYLTLYTSTPEQVRSRFVALAQGVGAGGSSPEAGSVWAADRSGGFTLRTQDDIGPNGQLLLPKLFRRATDYLRAKSSQTFVEWVAAQGEDDDPVEYQGKRTTLSALLRQDGDQVSLTASILDLVFVEPT